MAIAGVPGLMLMRVNTNAFFEMAAVKLEMGRG